MTRPVRTLLFSTLYPSSARPIHGIFVETRLRELLKSGRVDVRVVAPVPWFGSRDPRWGVYADMARTPPRETWHGVDVLHPRYLLLPKIGMTLAPLTLALGALGAVRRLLDEGFDFEVIDAHYYYPDGVAAALLARHFGRPLAITARGTDLNLIPEHALPRRMIRWAAERADASIGVCRALVDVLGAWGVDERKLHVFRNGVDLVRFAPAPPAQARADLSIQGEGPVIVSAGHLIERKGQYLIVDAMPAILAERPGARLYLVGDGDMRPALEAQIRRLGLEASVHLVGAVPNDRMAAWFSAADLSVLASAREGWANVLLESMACGAPVVATRIWGTPEVVADRVAGRLVDRRDAASIATGVLELLRDLPPRADVRRYAEQFSWDRTTQQQVELFDRLAGLSGPR